MFYCGMGLRLLAHFYERNEALIVCGALESEGVVVFVENQNQVAVQPLSEIALGGYRIMVREEELGDAVAILEEARRNPSVDGGLLKQRTFILLSLLLMVLLGVFLPLRISSWSDQ